MTLLRRIQHLIRTGKTTAPTQEGGVVQRVQASFSSIETADLQSVQHYGFASSIIPGCDVVSVHRQGDNTMGVIIASNDQRYRPTTLLAGEVMIYDNHGHKITITNTGIVIDGGGHNITINNAPKVVVNGDIEATGDIKAGTVSLKNHKHTAVATGGGLSGAPQP